MATNPFSRLQPADFTSVAEKLLPPGRLFPGLLDAPTQGALLAGWAYPVWSLHAAIIDFVDVEADPASTLQLLPDWEAEYGLPDCCTPLGATVEQRRTALLGKVASIGGQSDAYLISVAAAMGVAVTITHLAASKFGVSKFGDPFNAPPCDFTMVIHAPQLQLIPSRFGLARFGDPFNALSNTQLACRLSAIAPADNYLLFQYS